jgi:hypothetical protein
MTSEVQAVVQLLGLLHDRGSDGLRGSQRQDALA